MFVYTSLTDINLFFKICVLKLFEWVVHCIDKL